MYSLPLRDLLFRLSLLLLLFSATSLFAQEQRFYDLQGKVLNVKDSTGLPFVHLTFKANYGGWVSDELGRFLIYIPEDNLDDSLQFSSIGFAVKTIAIEDALKSDSLVIMLERSSTFLPEVLVTDKADSALMIMKEAIARIPENYPKKPYRMEGFYREANVENDKYARLVEAAVSMDDQGYKKPLSKMKYRVKALRKSDDLRELDWYGAVKEWVREKNGLVTFFMDNDLLRKNTGNTTTSFYETFILSRMSVEQFYSKGVGLEKYLNNREMDIVDYTTYEGAPVWIIETSTAKDGKKNNFGINGLVSEGRLYIKQDDFAILRYDFYLKVLPPPRKREDLLSPSVKNDRYENVRRLSVDGENLLYRTVRYTPYLGRYYLSYMETKISGTSSRFLGSNWGKKKENEEGLPQKKAKFYEQKQLMISKVIPNKRDFEKIKGKEKMDTELALHNMAFPYDALFWSRYALIKRNPLGKDAQAELSMNAELESQFKANEQPHMQASRLSATDNKYQRYTTEYNTIEYLPTLNEHALQLKGVSDDPTYGYSVENPIMLGTRNVFSNSSSYPRMYLNALLDKNKEPIEYKIKGYVHPFRTPNSRASIGNNPQYSFGLLVRCEVWSTKDKEPKTLYLNLNDSGDVLAPKGFRYRK